MRQKGHGSRPGEQGDDQTFELGEQNAPDTALFVTAQFVRAKAPPSLLGLVGRQALRGLHCQRPCHLLPDLRPGPDGQRLRRGTVRG
jgi:hypothetical protein